MNLRESHDQASTIAKRRLEQRGQIQVDTWGFFLLHMRSILFRSNYGATVVSLQLTRPRPGLLCSRAAPSITMQVSVFVPQ